MYCKWHKNSTSIFIVFVGLNQRMDQSELTTPLNKKKKESLIRTISIKWYLENLILNNITTVTS